MSFQCTSALCGHQQCQSQEDFVRIGAWPGTPHVTRFETVIDERTLIDYQRLKFHSPQSSMQGFLRTLEDGSRDYGYEVKATSRAGFV